MFECHVSNTPQLSTNFLEHMSRTSPQPAQNAHAQTRTNAQPKTFA
jgi:hypothetical protein